jgi:PIN domain nuclease of toxin-antitoxin system
VTKYLADTQIVVWAAGFAHRLSGAVRSVLEESANTIYVSSVSIAEMAIKQSIGKLSLPVPPLQLVSDLDFETIPLTAHESQYLAALPLLHRDPFDRLLIAQAIVGELTLITADEQIWLYPGVNILANNGR